MSTSPLVYAITLNWNRCEDTLACLNSLDNLTYPNKRVLLIDNASTDGSVTAVAEKFPGLEIIVNERNLGFGAGFNVGLRHALANGADYIFIMNNDAEAAPDILEQMLPLFGEDVGLVAPKIFYASDPARIWSVGGQRHPLTIEKTGDARGQLDGEQWGKIMERDYFAGCALMFSRRLLIDTGLFDERFFMYYEDSDFSQRARQAGFRLLLAPGAHVWHKVSVSSGGSDSPNERYWMARSSVLFFNKHVSGWRWLIVLPYRTGSALKTVLRLLSQRRGAAAKAYLLGLWHGFTEIRQLET